MLQVLLGLFFLFLLGCSTSVESNAETGHHKITCNNETSSCYEKASQLCPDGYLVTNRVRPKKSGDDTIFTLQIKCRSGKIFY